MKTNTKRRTYNTLARRNETIKKHNQKSMWKLLLAVTLGAVTAIISPYASEVINGVGDRDYFPTVEVHAENFPEAVLEATEGKEETDREAIERIAKVKCDEKGLGDYCVKDLIAMAWTESRFNCKAVGDGGKSHGCFQLHLGYHKHITVAQAQDIEFAVSWTLNRLIAYNYPTMRSTSVMRHNGTPNTKATKAYLETVNNYVNSL